MANPTNPTKPEILEIYSMFIPGSESTSTAWINLKGGDVNGRMDVAEALEKNPRVRAGYVPPEDPSLDGGILVNSTLQPDALITAIIEGLADQQLGTIEELGAKIGDSSAIIFDGEVLHVSHEENNVRGTGPLSLPQ